MLKIYKYRACHFHVFNFLGYYGDALSDRREDGCKLCQCFPPGTIELDDRSVAPCDQLSGHCICKPHVTGRNCDKCEDGYYEIMSEEVNSDEAFSDFHFQQQLISLG